MDMGLLVRAYELLEYTGCTATLNSVCIIETSACIAATWIGHKLDASKDLELGNYNNPDIVQSIKRLYI
ncbi:hypothetical protein P8452_02861 [Trifolium repens]|nr:hypothetical protein P8452_02861 [Trifolium repens]